MTSSPFVTELPKAWLLYSQSKQWNKAPSEILHIENTYVAYCLDEAIWWFGNYVESEVKKASASKGKSDNEKKQKHRADLAFARIMGSKPKFANTEGA